MHFKEKYIKSLVVCCSIGLSNFISRVDLFVYDIYLLIIRARLLLSIIERSEIAI